MSKRRTKNEHSVIQYWIVRAATAILMFASVLLHELGHSVVSLGYKVPVRSITLLVFGGVAQLGAEPPSAIAEMWIAIAGPAVSFAWRFSLACCSPLSARLPAFGPGEVPVLYQRHAGSL